jgi:hypothetical protein
VQEQGEPDEFGFDSKINELIESNRIDKVCLIVKYFGKHSWISQEGVERLVESYRRAIMRKVFRALQEEIKENSKYFDYR